MKKSWFMKGLALTVALAMGAASPMIGLAAENVQAQESAVRDSIENQNGLTGVWYKAKDGGREDMSRFEFVDNNMLGILQYDQLKRDGQDFKGTIANLIGHNNDEQFALAKFTGDIEVPETGEYTFYMEGDDGFRLYIDGESVIDFWTQQWEKEQSGKVTLEKGRHDIEVHYLQGWGGAWLEMRWECQAAGIEKEVVPAEAFWQTKENYLLQARTDLGKEIEKASSVYENYKDTPGAEALKAELDKAQAMYDADYSDAEDVEVIAQQMEAQTKALADAKTALYMAMGTQKSEPFTEFYNALYQGQDPFVTQKDGYYYLVSSSNLDSERKIYVSKSRTLSDQGEKKMIMDLSIKDQGRVFAPELFYFETEELGGRWYIYYCADVGNYEKNYPETAAKYKLNDQEHHVACCLRSKTDDPMGEWEDMGPLYCGEGGVIYGANDITAFEYDGSIFLVWGTLGPNQPMGPAIVEMDNPWTVSKDRAMLPVGGGEGPRALKNANGDLFITMSEGDYQSDGYRLSLLSFKGDSKEELLSKDKWEVKRDVFTSNSTVSGPGRASFVKSADGTEDWMVYHSRVYRAVGRNSWREVNIKPFTWNEDGTPNFGTPVSPNTKMALPSGDPGQGDMYQAENAVLEGGAYVENTHYNHQGTGYVHVPNTTGTSVNFVVNAPEAGDYIVGMRYAYGKYEDNATTDGATNQLPSRASISIYVNGEKADTLLMDKTNLSWNEYFTGSKRLNLKEGQNLITYIVDNGNIGDVNLDYLTMYKADVPYNETEVKPESITLDKTDVTLKEGESTTLTATVLPETAENKNVIYTTSDENIASVDAQGNVTAKKEGTAVITVTAEADQNVKAECKVTVEKKAGEVVDPDPEEPQEPQNPQQPGNGNAGDETGKGKTAGSLRTGDESNLPLAAGAAILALGAGGAAFAMRKKRG